MSDFTGVLREQMRAMTEPVRTSLVDLDERIAKAEAELSEMRELRREARKLLQLVDGEAAANGKPRKTKPKPRMSGDTVTLIGEWLQAHRDELPDVWSSATLSDEHGYDVRSRQVTNDSLKTLHERGLIRFVRKGRGGVAYYSLV